MNLPFLALWVDIAAIVLLVAVIFYSIRLNKYFMLLRNGKDDLARQLSAFAESTKRAEEAMDRMKASTRENANLLDQQIRRAELVRKDLSRDSRGQSVGSDARKGTESSSSGVRRRKTSTSASAEEEDSVAAVAPSSARERLMRHRRPSSGEKSSDADADGGATEGGDVSRRQRSKSKSELLKALQGMR